jgi:hypothetical protein
MADARKERIARNENAFRALNESLGTAVHKDRADGDLAGFVCECGNADCDTLVRVSMPAYESIRKDSRLFLVFPGHEVPEAEDVVDGGDGYAVVRKHDDVAETVERGDPRTSA